MKKPYSKTKPRKPRKTNIKKQIQNEVNKIVKIEKKRVNTAYATTDYSCGQVSGNAEGYFASDISPIINQNDSVDGRTGSLVTITSMYMTLQLRQMSAGQSPCLMRFYLIRARGYNDSTAQDVVQNLFNTNNFIGAGNQITDYLSDMKIDMLGNYQILKTFTVSIKPDNYTNQQMPTARIIKLKWKKGLAYRLVSNSTAVSQGRMFLFGFSSNGNASALTSCTLANVPITAVATGQLINFNIKWYYTDA